MTSAIRGLTMLLIGMNAILCRAQHGHFPNQKSSIQSVATKSCSHLVEDLLNQLTFDFTQVLRDRGRAITTHAQLASQPATSAQRIVDLNVLEANWNKLKAAHSKQKLMAVLKADGYEHGALDTALFLQAMGQDLFGVATASEALALRAGGIKGRIVVLSPISPFQVADCARNKIEIMISSMEHLRLITDVNIPISVHLKVDTGLGRYGVSMAEAETVTSFLNSHKNINVQAIYSHFSKAENMGSNFTETQYQRFIAFRERFTRNYRSDPTHKIEYHLSNSAGLMRDPKYHFDYARVGIGLWSSVGFSQKGLAKNFIPTKQVITVRAPITGIRTARAGDRVGYGGTYIAKEGEVIANVGIGYEDGIPRSFSNLGYISLGGKQYPIVGNVSMDSLTISLGKDSGSKIGDWAYITGSLDQSAPPLQDLADIGETVPQEILTNFGNRVQRLYVYK